MHFYRNIYVGDSIKKDSLFKIKWKLKHHKHTPGIYVIVLPDESDELEFYHSEYLQQSYYKKNPPYIVGIAKGWDEACNLVGKMLIDVFHKYGNYHIGEYIRSDI